MPLFHWLGISDFSVFVFTAAIVFYKWSLAPRRSSKGEVKKFPNPHDLREQRRIEKQKASLMELNFDPANNSTLEHFQSVKNNSKCIFAKQAHLWGAREFDPSSTLEENVEQTLPALIKFVCQADTIESQLDGFLIEVRGEKYCDGIDSFAATVRRVLDVISIADPAGVHCMAMRSIDKPSWHFSFYNTPLFITTFAPFYPVNHARYMYPDDSNAQSCFILVQPEMSFYRRKIGADTPHTNFKNPVTMRDKIRCSFYNSDQKYHIPSSNNYPVSTSYIAHPAVLDPAEAPEDVCFWDKERYPDIVQ